MIADISLSYLKDPKGLKSWLFTLDHKRIGLMYLFSIMFFLFYWWCDGHVDPVRTFKSGVRTLWALILIIRCSRCTGPL